MGFIQNKGENEKERIHFRTTEVRYKQLTSYQSKKGAGTVMGILLPFTHSHAFMAYTGRRTTSAVLRYDNFIISLAFQSVNLIVILFCVDVCPPIRPIFPL